MTDRIERPFGILATEVAGRCVNTPGRGRHLARGGDMDEVTERWLPIPGFPGYEVSDQGRVRSWRSWQRGEAPRVLAGGSHNGYRTVYLSRDGRRCTMRAHTLVLLVFVGPRPEGQETRHLDGDRSNNTLSNLRYGTPAENMADRRRHGTHNNGRKTHCKHGHPFSPENTRRWRNKRICKTCANERAARWKRASA